jgi:hypothetical protein
MHVWIVLLTLLFPQPQTPVEAPQDEVSATPMRYRGIENLFAKFEAEQPPR